MKRCIHISRASIFSDSKTYSLSCIKVFIFKNSNLMHILMFHFSEKMFIGKIPTYCWRQFFSPKYLTSRWLFSVSACYCSFVKQIYQVLTENCCLLLLLLVIQFYQKSIIPRLFFVCFCYCLFFAVLSQIYQNFCLLLLLFVIAVSSKSIIP